jgi:hypothetical protein
VAILSFIGLIGVNYMPRDQIGALERSIIL